MACIDCYCGIVLFVLHIEMRPFCSGRKGEGYIHDTWVTMGVIPDIILVATHHQDPCCVAVDKLINQDDAIKWKHFPRYWPFVRRIHRSPVNSPQKGQ